MAIVFKFGHVVVLSPGNPKHESHLAVDDAYKRAAEVENLLLSVDFCASRVLLLQLQEVGLDPVAEVTLNKVFVIPVPILSFSELPVAGMLLDIEVVLGLLLELSNVSHGLVDVEPVADPHGQVLSGLEFIFGVRNQTNGGSFLGA